MSGEEGVERERWNDGLSDGWNIGEGKKEMRDGGDERVD